MAKDTMRNGPLVDIMAQIIGSSKRGRGGYQFVGPESKAKSPSPPPPEFAKFAKPKKRGALVPGQGQRGKRA